MKPFIRLKTQRTTVKKLITRILASKDKNRNPYIILPYALRMMYSRRFRTARKEYWVDLVAVSIRDLFFTEKPQIVNPMTPEFCARWSEEYLDGYVIELCYPDDGPQLLWQWKDQPEGEVYMAMERINDAVFSVGCFQNGRRGLSGCGVARYETWDLDRVLIFRFRKVK